MTTATKKPSSTPGDYVETIPHGECAVDIFLKRQPSGFKHHGFTAPVKVRRGARGNAIITRTYSCQDEAELKAVIEKAAARCRELDARLFGFTTGEQ